MGLFDFLFGKKKQDPSFTLGDHDVRFQLHGEVFATLDVIVVAE